MPAAGKAGFSLIELLVAMTLFAIAALGLSASVALVSRAGALSEHLTRATILAQDKLEELVSQNVPLTGGVDRPHAGFTREWAVSPDDPEAGVTRIAVTVRWEGSELHSIALATMVND